jgi:hypothetical protein
VGAHHDLLGAVANDTTMFRASADPASVRRRLPACRARRFFTVKGEALLLQ